MKADIKTYVLEKDSKVTIYKIFGNQYYFAVVEMNGRYPKQGFLSNNRGRDEFVVLLSGKISIIKNGKTIGLNEGDHELLENGCKYEIVGKGKCMVFVNDGKDAKGKSEIISKSELYFPAKGW